MAKQDPGEVKVKLVKATQAQPQNQPQFDGFDTFEIKLFMPRTGLKVCGAVGG